MSYLQGKLLQWSSHVSTVCKNVSFYLFWISYHRKCLSSLIAKMLLDSLALSQINYALPVWGPTISKQAVSRLQCLQNRAVRITKSLSKHNDVSHHRQTLNWLSVASQIQYRLLCAIYHHYHPSHAVFQLYLVPSIHIVPNVLRILQIWIDVDYLLLKTFFDIMLHTGGINFQTMLFHYFPINLPPQYMIMSTFYIMINLCT